MPIKEVILLGNSELREISTEIDFKEENFKLILKDLKDTLEHLQEAKKIGRALAAPQIGWKKQVIFYNLPNQNFYMINPRILYKSKEMFEVWDSCFCFDVSFFVQILRHKEIKVEYQDINKNRHEEVFNDNLSELIQHEIDHLDGILATDYLTDPKKIIMRSEWERRYC
jgi:peptide deformylase